MITIEQKYYSFVDFSFCYEPFLDIILGEKLLSFEEFSEKAERLCLSRTKGSYICIKKREIKKMYGVYESLSGEMDLTKRAALLNTVFMKTIVQDADMIFTNFQKQYLTKISLPASLNFIGKGHLLEINAYKQWLELYRLKCTNEDFFHAEKILFYGYSKKKQSELLKKGAAIYSLWKKEYEKGKISKEDIKKLLTALISSFQYPDYKNSTMVKVFNAYKAYAFDFSSDKQEIYWETIFQSIANFLERV